MAWLLFFPLQEGMAFSKPDGRTSTTRHDKLEILKGPFETGQEVTRACMTCHTEAAEKVRQSTHWTWTFQAMGSKRTYGKSHVLNTFCGAIASNLSLCTSCHIGYGWKEPGGGEERDEQVDCLVCHEQTGGYKKYSYGLATLNFNGKVLRKPDFVAMAQSVSRPSRANCGSCHFYGGSGDGAKHGDLDSSLIRPDRYLDVHMDASGLNFDCITCHSAPDHQITGSRYIMKSRDPMGIDRPGRTDSTRASCASCHGNAPHQNKDKLNDHLDRVACQTCHIPAMARGGVETMVYWDWSVAGQKQGLTQVPERLRLEGHESSEIHFRHDRKHGSTLWASQLAPRYVWFSGRMDFIAAGEKIDDGGVVPVNRIFGKSTDLAARIWPFKKMMAMMPYDPVNRTMVVNHMVRSDAEDKEAFEASMDWKRSVTAGMKAASLPFSGEVGFVPAEMYFPLTHMIAPKEEALSCSACHRDGGRLEDLEGFYLPGQKSFPMLHFIGFGFVCFTLSGIGIHAGLRGFVSLRRGMRKP